MSLSRYVQQRYDCGDNVTWNSQRRLRYAMPKSLPSLSEREDLGMLCRGRRHRAPVYLPRESLETDINADAALNIDDKLRGRILRHLPFDKITSGDLSPMISTKRS